MAKKKSSSDEIKEIECKKCSSSVKLANRKANRCPNCGLEYDRNGDLITGDVVCPECWGTVYLISKESNECEFCGLKYDGTGRPVVGEPPPGKYIGDQEVGSVGTSSMESYYVDYNGDETWTVYHHGGHPDLIDEEGPYDADELLEALEEFGFEREEVVKKKIEGLNSALKQGRTLSGGSGNRDVER
jgi:hypothetical protein